MVSHRITGDRRGQGHDRGIGWEFVHVCIDDASRIAFVQVMPDDTKQSAVAFLNAAVAYYESHGVKVARVMTDNGGCYRALAFRDACRALALRHIRTKPYTPRTNGKPSASSKLPCENGPMPRPTSTQIIEKLTCRSGFIATIGIDRTAA
jgi:hypothetical protein